MKPNLNKQKKKKKTLSSEIPMYHVHSLINVFRQIRKTYTRKGLEELVS